MNAAQLVPALALARLEQGRLLGQLDAIGLTQMADIRRELWVQDTLATAAIEGEPWGAIARTRTRCKL